MRKFAIALFLLVSACRSGSRSGADDGPGSPAVGAADARSALDAFLASVRAQDLQAMSRVWGGERGLARDQLSRDALEKRELLIMCHIAHDNFRVVTEYPARDQDRRRVFLVRLNRGGEFRETTFTTYKNGQGRWFLEEAAMEPVRDFCRRMPGT